METHSSADKELIHGLRERIKELECTYAVSRIALDRDASFDQIIQDITDIIPSAFQDPGSVWACVTIGDRTVRTTNFRDCPWRLEADTGADAGIGGKLEVGYVGPASSDGSPFLKEEEKLVRDIATRIGFVLKEKALKDSLEDSERRYRSLVENSLTGIFQVTLEGRFLYANDIFLEMLGYDSFAELAGVNFLSLYRDPRKSASVINRLKRHKKLSAHEVELVTRAGQPITLLLSMSLENNIQAGTAMDITERKRIEEELRAKSVSLEETNTALKVLLNERQRSLEEVQDAFISNVKHLVLPYVKRLRETALRGSQEALLTTVEANLRSILSPFLRNLFDAHSGFTPSEVKVASLIREGHTVKEIAGILNVSLSSVNLHRQNIRNKLGLNKEKVRLHAYLASLSK